MSIKATILALLSLGFVAAAPAQANQPIMVSNEASQGLSRLLSNKGVSLQWIDERNRGSVWVYYKNEVLKLNSNLYEPGSKASLSLNGIVSEIGADYFIFDGTIRILDTPDDNRHCEKTKKWHFAITQNRPYYRLREFEWCDYLTDYIDIHF